jgi:peptidoglycan/LPS O-acetylase OafA/YrhL
MAETTDLTKPRLRLAYLDGLRAIAASYVVGFHAVLGFGGDELTGPFRVLKRVFAFGHEAVAVFIVLSGYCLMLPVVRAQPERDRVPFGSFLRRRAFRILPPYFAALLGSVLLLALVPALRARSGTTWDDSLPGLELGPLLSHALLLHNWSPTWGYQINGPFWSVASEWQIYFFFPLLLLPAWRRFGMPGALLAAAAVGYAPLLFAPAASMVAIPWYLLLFALGMGAAAIGFSSNELSARLRPLPWRPLSTALWLGCALFSVAAGKIWFANKPITDLLMGLAMATLLLSLTGRALGPKPGWLLSLLESRPLVRLGHFSYSLYLTHLPLLALGYFWLRELGMARAPTALLLLVAGGPISVAAAYVFYLVVEKRFIVKR